MSKKNSKYSYHDFHFSLVDANGYEYPMFNPNDPYGLDGYYQVSMSAMDFDYKVFTIHSAVRELTKFVKHHGNFTMGKDFFIKSLEVTAFHNQKGFYTDLNRDELQAIKALINPKLIWVDTEIK